MAVPAIRLILVRIDGSKCAARGLELALRLTCAKGARVIHHAPCRATIVR